MNNKWRIALAAILLVGMVSLAACSVKVKDGDTVKVSYILTLEDGTVYDSSPEDEPLEFTLGDKEVITGFENAVKGMKVGETKTVTIPPDEAYGQYYQELIQVVDRSQLPADIVPTVGQYIVGESTEDQITRTCLIMEVTDTTITVDCNYALAGKTLTFEITLIEIVAKEQS